MADVASAMKHLVDLGFVHRDLAAKNIQINAQLKCKLADMSMARKIADTQFPHQVTIGNDRFNGFCVFFRWVVLTTYKQLS